MRYKLVLEYEGSRYQGWLMRPNARSIQGAILDACRELFPVERDLRLVASENTEAGVHAFAQVAQLDLPRRLKAAKGELAEALNAQLPADIHVLSFEEVEEGFDVLQSRKAVSYVYQIARRRSAFSKPFSWWIREKLDAQAMLDAAQLLMDAPSLSVFDAQQESRKPIESKLDLLQVFESDEQVIVRLLGPQFMSQTLRRLVGCLGDVGQGRMTLKQVEQMLKPQYEHPAKFMAPASGLFCAAVYYEGEEIFEEPERMIIW